MSAQRVYLDYNASAPLRASAREAMLAVLDAPGNASSVHTEGRIARACVETSRSMIGRLVGAPARQIVFTSGATEAANLALTPSLTEGGEPIEWLLVGAGEHACVLSGHRFDAGRVKALPLQASGVVNLEALAAMLAETPGRCMVAVQAANNETGVVQPIAAIADRVHAKNGILICDAVQVAGRTICNFSGLPADILLISAHKLGGPKGVGALAFASDRLHISDALMRGGGQEAGARAGTENVAAIAGFGAAANEAFLGAEDEAARLSALRDAMEANLRTAFPELLVFGAETGRLPNTSGFAISGLSAETLLIALDLEGFALSSGSACSSGKVATSHVLKAMGVEPDLARGALRVSLGERTTEKEVTVFCETFEKTVRNIRARRIKPAA